MAKSYLVTGGTGFIGSALVRRLVGGGDRVRVLDNNWRGASRRLADLRDDLELVEGDIRDPRAVRAAAAGMESVVHLAYINGTEFFYSRPELVLEVAVKGMTNVIDACLAEDVGELVVASSSEVYQVPPVVPTDETAPLSVPDPLNPRYSYGGGKILCELMALNWGRRHFERVLVFRPHNVYGPDMGWEHVLPQFILRMNRMHRRQPEGVVDFPIQGSGAETRAFNYIDDFIEGVMCMLERGEHLNVYHVGTSEEVSIADVARRVGRWFGREIELVPGEPAAGGTARRCPDITKLAALGYRPRVALDDGLPRIAEWYVEHADMAPEKESTDA